MGQINQDNFKELFGKRFRQALIERNFKHIEFAEQTGISAKQISMYSTGNALPTVYGLRLIVDALDISSDFLLGVTNEIIPTQKDKNPELSEEILAMRNYYVNMDPEIRKSFTEFLQAISRLDI